MQTEVHMMGCSRFAADASSGSGNATNPPNPRPAYWGRVLKAMEGSFVGPKEVEKLLALFVNDGFEGNGSCGNELTGRPQKEADADVLEALQQWCVERVESSADRRVILILNEIQAGLKVIRAGELSRDTRWWLRMKKVTNWKICKKRARRRQERLEASERCNQNQHQFAHQTSSSRFPDFPRSDFPHKQRHVPYSNYSNPYPRFSPSAFQGLGSKAHNPLPNNWRVSPSLNYISRRFPSSRPFLSGSGGEQSGEVRANQFPAGKAYPSLSGYHPEDWSSSGLGNIGSGKTFGVDTHYRSRSGNQHPFISLEEKVQFGEEVEAYQREKMGVWDPSCFDFYSLFGVGDGSKSVSEKEVAGCGTKLRDLVSCESVSTCVSPVNLSLSGNQGKEMESFHDDDMWTQLEWYLWTQLEGL